MVLDFKSLIILATEKDTKCNDNNFEKIKFI